MLPASIRILFSDGIITGSLAAIILNLILSKKKEEAEPEIHRNIKSYLKADNEVLRDVQT